MNFSKLSFLSFVALAAAFGTGCAAQDDSSDTSEGAIVAGGVPYIPKAADLWPADTKTVTARVSGGFQMEPPPGSECLLGDETIKLEVATGKFSWERCDRGGFSTLEGEIIAGVPPLEPPPYRFVRGARVITAEQVGGVKDAVNGLVKNTNPYCGADAPSYSVTLDSASDKKIYADDFYSCDAQPGVTYVQNIHTVFRALETFAVPVASK